MDIHKALPGIDPYLDTNLRPYKCHYHIHVVCTYHYQLLPVTVVLPVVPVLLINRLPELKVAFQFFALAILFPMISLQKSI